MVAPAVLVVAAEEVEERVATAAMAEKDVATEALLLVPLVQAAAVAVAEESLAIVKVAAAVSGCLAKARAALLVDMEDLAAVPQRMLMDRLWAATPVAAVELVTGRARAPM